MKEVLKKIIGIDRINKTKSFFALIWAYISDFYMYLRYSNIFFDNKFEMIEAKIILAYHSIEKGMLFENRRPEFADYRIKELRRYLNHSLVVENNSKNQIQVALKIICEYYDIHLDMNHDISHYYDSKMYSNFKKRIIRKNENFSGYESLHNREFYKDIDSNFFKFSNSRKSIRTFTGEIIPEHLVLDSVALAQTAPSVCNRQSTKVYYVSDKLKIDKILNLQHGFIGYSEKVKQLLMVTSNRNSFYTAGERYQFYIDGGIFLMNLLYSLHYKKIACCPANWAKLPSDDKKIRKIISIPESEKIICLIPIGLAAEEFRITRSERRPVDEILVKV